MDYQKLDRYNLGIRSAYCIQACRVIKKENNNWAACTLLIGESLKQVTLSIWRLFHRVCNTNLLQSGKHQRSLFQKAEGKQG